MLQWLTLLCCCLSHAGPLKSALGVLINGPNMTAVLAVKGSFVPLRLVGQSSDLRYLLAAYTGPESDQYYVMDQQSHLYQVSQDGSIGQVTTYPTIYNPQCVAFDRLRDHVIVITRGQLYVLDPFDTKPISSWSVSVDGVTSCQVNATNQELWVVQSQAPTFTIYSYATGKFRTITGLSASPLSVDFFSGGVLFLSNSGSGRQWGGVSVLNLMDPNTGKTTQFFNYSFPEGGMVPTDHAATCLVGLDASDPSHILFESIMWDTENDFICDAGVEYRDGKFLDHGGDFAVFGNRPGEFLVLAIATGPTH